MTDPVNTSNRPAAEVYEEKFVPALFGPWGQSISDLAGITTAHAVLDVACGTGALTCVAAQRVGSSGSVVGLDLNPEMLAIARRKPYAIEWKRGQAEAIPFADASFDRVVSQFGMMFFEDPTAALREMMRVLRPGGRMAVAVCDGIDHSPGYAVFTELLHRLFGEPVAQGFRAPFSLGDRKRLEAIVADAGIGGRVTRHEGTVHFDSIAALVATERACAWTLGGLLDEAQFTRLLDEAEESLRPFVDAKGRIAFGMPALVIQAEKPA